MTAQRHIEDFDGFALQLLDTAEQRDGEAHLLTCESCRRSVAEAGAAAHTLLSLAPPIEPRECLGERVMAAFTAAVGQQRIDAVRRPGTAPMPAPGAREPLWRRLMAPAPALAFALVLAVAGLLAWGVTTNNRLQESESSLDQHRVVVEAIGRGGRAVALAPQADGIAGTATLVIPPDGKPSFLMRGAATPAGDRVYEIWLLKDGQPTPAGTFRPGEGTTIVEMPLAAEGYDLVAITEEPAGGSPLPTGQVLMAGEIVES